MFLARSLSIALIGVTACGGASTRIPKAPLVVTASELQPSDSNGPPTVDARLLEPHRIAGEKNVTPDGRTIDAVHASGAKLIGSFKACLDSDGRVSSVRILKTTTVPDYDAKIVRHIEEWRFTPVVLDGKQIEVCTAVTFIFTAH